MIAPSSAATVALTQPAIDTHADFDGTLSVNRIVATLQIMLAARRAARSEDDAYWYTVARGM